MALTASETNSPPTAADVASRILADTNAQATSLAGYVPDDKYKLRVGDRISFQIVEDHDAPKSLGVVDSGEVDIPYIGRVSAINKTCKQLASELKAQLEKEYYYRATVIIALDAANKVLGRIYIWARSNSGRPGNRHQRPPHRWHRHPARRGLRRFCKKNASQTHPRRWAGQPPKKTTELNMAEVLEDGKVEKDVPVQPDDFIIVPSRLINF